MPFIEKQDTAQMLEPGDDVTMLGIRGTVMDTEFRLARLTLNTERGVETTYVPTNETVLVYDESGESDKYSPEFLTEGLEVMANGHRGILASLGFTDIHATIARDDEIVNLRLTGDEPVVYHNWFEHPDPECETCTTGQHHGPPTIRCTCCGRHMALWALDFS